MKRILSMIDGLLKPPDTWFELADQLRPFFDEVWIYDRRDLGLVNDAHEAAAAGDVLNSVSHSFGVQTAAELTATLPFARAVALEGVWEMPKWQRVEFQFHVPAAWSFIRKWKHASTVTGPPSMGLRYRAGHRSDVVDDLSWWGWTAHSQIIERVTPQIVEFFRRE